MQRTCYTSQSTFAPAYPPVRSRNQSSEEASSEAASPELTHVHTANPGPPPDLPRATSGADAGTAARAFLQPRTDISAPVRVRLHVFGRWNGGGKALLSLGVRKYTVRRRVRCGNGNVLVWLSNRWRGWGSEKRYCPPVAALYSGWHGNEWNVEGVHDTVKWNFEFGDLPPGGGALDFDLPSCIGEVCPPGGHMLERGVQAQLGAKVCGTKATGSRRARFAQVRGRIGARFAPIGAARATSAGWRRGMIQLSCNRRGAARRGGPFRRRSTVCR